MPIVARSKRAGVEQTDSCQPSSRPATTARTFASQPELEFAERPVWVRVRRPQIAALKTARCVGCGDLDRSGSKTLHGTDDSTLRFVPELLVATLFGFFVFALAACSTLMLASFLGGNKGVWIAVGITLSYAAGATAACRLWRQHGQGRVMIKLSFCTACQKAALRAQLRLLAMLLAVVHLPLLVVHLATSLFPTSAGGDVLIGMVAAISSALFLVWRAVPTIHAAEAKTLGVRDVSAGELTLTGSSSLLSVLQQENPALIVASSTTCALGWVSSPVATRSPG